MLNARKTAKKGLTVKAGGAIILDVAASDGAKHRSGRQRAILENDTEKVILYKKRRRRALKKRDEASMTVRFERVKRLDEMEKATGFGELVVSRHGS